MNDTQTLKFGKPNAKLKKMAKKLGLKLSTFTLPAGYTCPGASDCLAFADRITGKVKDGAKTEFRCFMASAEARSPSLRQAVWHNLELIKNALQNSVADCVSLIEKSLPKCDVCRVHVGGDYFSKKYLLAWVEVAKRNPQTVFYSYSKSLPFFEDIALPENLVLTASRGGKFDNLIDQLNWKKAVVVFSKAEAKKLDLEIDSDDEKAAFGKKDFALLIHGTQPKGSEASKALQAVKASS
jgi:hypothetical protein|tara:strand:+ start:22980 stop:23696 length:717 start_codon:yes stop_codon:yes gene_type:complete